ncbi:MAG TPA: TetR/AcrR family transcriptional regulator [Acidimicrobiales bacterium]|jgi:AcrR family transcriptional regulator|nr:TetR/AcrR family transcriptional regulator [Acidimicrobiales bacterium]
MIAPLAASTSDPEHRPSGARAGAREQAILDAALELVLEVGYDRLSMDALAERAHAGKATIYRHWSGKAEVVFEALRRRHSGEELVPDTGSLRGDLLATIASIDASVSSEDGALISGLLCAMRTDPVLANLMRTQVVDSKRTNCLQLVDRAVARGELPPSATGDVLFEVMPAMVTTRLVINGEELTEEFAVHLVDDILIPLLQS